MPPRKRAVRRKRTGLRARPRIAKNFVKIQFPAMYVRVHKSRGRKR